MTSGENSEVKARRVRSEECSIETVNGPVNIGSYIEARKLSIKTQEGNINIGKRLGIVDYGLIE